MSLETTTTNEEKAGTFKDLVMQRDYEEATTYYNNLSEEQQSYIKQTYKYSRWLRPLRVSKL